MLYTVVTKVVADNLASVVDPTSVCTPSHRGEGTWSIDCDEITIIVYKAMPNGRVVLVVSDNLARVVYAG